MGNNRKYEKKYVDYTLLFVTLSIIGFGLMMIYSTSSYSSVMKTGDANTYFLSQLKFTVIGLVFMFVAYMIDYHWWQKLAIPAYIFASALVMALLVVGSSEGGATRWIRFGSIGIQPAEVSKVAVMMLMSAMIVKNYKKINRLRYAALLWALIAGFQFVIVLVISQNLSSAIIIAAIGLAIVFVAYPKYWPFVLATVVGAIATVIMYVWLVNNIDSAGAAGNFRALRLFIWVDPERFIDAKGYQTCQALYAIGSGGLLGKGLGNSLQKLGYIPESQNDMIFSIICEEFGIVGAAILIFVFGVMLWRIKTIASQAPDLFGALMTTGVFAHIALQVVLNIAVVTNLIPNTGVSLPFISYGGSAAVMLLFEIGIVMNISSKIKIDL